MTTRDEFITQYEKRQYFDTPIGHIEFREATPVGKIAPLPVLFAPGWREAPELLQECIFEIYKTGRRVITLSHPTKTSKTERYEDFPKIEAQKAQTLLALIKNRNVTKVDVITHSEGAINSAIAATIQPEYFNTLTLITPAGLTGKDSFTRLTLGFITHLGNLAKIKRGIQKKGKREKVRLLTNATVAIQEVRALTRFDIHPLLLQLHKKGVPTGMLLGKTDIVFPYKKVITHLSRSGSAPYYGLDLIMTKPGGHKLYTDPEGIMSQVISILQQLEKL